MSPLRGCFFRQTRERQNRGSSPTVRQALLNRSLENRPHETHREDQFQLPASAQTSIHQTAAAPAQARRVPSDAASLSPIPSDKRTVAHHTKQVDKPSSPLQSLPFCYLHRVRSELGR